MGFRMHRKDGNHDEIAEAYRLAGYKVKSTTMVGEGFPDLVLHRDDMPEGYVKIVEVKNPDGSDRDEKKQKKFREKGWPVHVVRSVEEIA